MHQEKLEYIPLYINGASQVEYYDPDTMQYYGGIVFMDQLISGQTGEHWQADEYTMWASALSGKNPDQIIITLTWENLSPTILRGGTLPSRWRARDGKDRNK